MLNDRKIWKADRVNTETQCTVQTVKKDKKSRYVTVWEDQTYLRYEKIRQIFF